MMPKHIQLLSRSDMTKPNESWGVQGGHKLLLVSCTQEKKNKIDISFNKMSYSLLRDWNRLVVMHSSLSTLGLCYRHDVHQP